MIASVTEAAQRSDIADHATQAASQAADAASRVATQVAKRSADLGSQAGERLAKRSADLGSQAGERLGEVAQAVTEAVTEEGRALMAQRAANRSSKKAKKPRRHRIRRAALLAGGGALAAYFLDPQNGEQRRTTVMRRTSTSAQTVGDSLDKAAQVAHQTAEATAPDSTALTGDSLSHQTGLRST
ncbi:MAG: hypothetical protein ACTHOG_12560 [Marmoricola sp.]